MNLRLSCRDSQGGQGTCLKNRPCQFDSDSRHLAPLVMNCYLYIVRCQDKSLYTGITNNIEKRLIQHNSGKGAKSIRGKLPVTLVYSERFATKSEALKREYEIKRWSKKEKEVLVTRDVVK